MPADLESARPSSTVVLARAAVAEPEIFMVCRHEASSFGSAHAFPGGVLDAEDARVQENCADLTPADASARLGVDKDGLVYYIAALRELFEESGVLLADIGLLDENLAFARDSLNDGTLKWDDFVHRNELSLHCGDLYYFSHWVTPDAFKKRYSTRFFLAEMPAGQQAFHCGGELTDSRWATARELLAAGRRGDIKLHYPTVKTLESVARHKSMDALLDWGRSSVDWGITSMIPAVIHRNGKQEIVLPGDRDYPGAKS